MKKRLPWIILALAIAVVAFSLLPKPKGVLHTREFGELPVLLNGRIQPLDSVARNSLLELRTKQTVALEGKKELTAIEWLLEVMMKPEVADDRKVFRIDNGEVLSLLKLPEKEKYFSFAQLRPSYDEIGQQAQRIEKRETDKLSTPENRSVFEKQLMKLHDAVILYQRLEVSLRPPRSDDFVAELADYKQAVGPGVAAVRASQAGQSFDQNAYDRILGLLAQYQAVARFAYVLSVPPSQPEVSRDDWKNIGTGLMEAARGAGISPAIDFYAAMTTAYRQNKPAEFNQAVQQYRQWLGEKFVPELKKGRREFFFNDVQAFYKAMIIYVLTFLLACAFWFNSSEWLRRSAFYLMAFAWVIHTFGLVFRMCLEGRPPVTNLYSSAIFIGWGAVILGMVLERFYRDGIGTVVGSLAGFVTQVIAHNLAVGGDTMEMLRAVLDTNFWLATHVVVVTLGYASTFVAGLLAVIYIVRGLFTSTLADKTVKALSRMVYGIICFATLFSFVGTVLGGIWADQSWGRFWGWDPKENGALLIVIWNALILHARWGGIVRERGIMNLAVFGNVVTSFSWFGVNMLGIGLHSYGFMDAAFKWLMMFVVSQLLLIGDGMLPRACWRSFQTQNTNFGTAVRWAAIALNLIVMVVGFFLGFNSIWCLLSLAIFFGFVLTIFLATKGTPSSPTASAVVSGPKTAPAATGT